MFCCQNGDPNQMKMCCHKLKGAIFALFFVVLIIAGIVWIQGKIKENQYVGEGLANKNTINVVGTGQIFVQPDIALISLSVVSESKKISDAQNDNTQKMNNIIGFLKNDLGILDKDLKTTNYNIYSDYTYTRDGQKIFLGYKITQTLEVKIRDLSKVGNVIEGATERGSNEISSLQFTNEDLEKTKVDARKLAIDDAKEKAKTLVSQLGVKLGKIVSFNENFYTPIPMPTYKEAIGLGGGGTTPDIQTGENKISVTVSITYEIE